MRAKKTRKKCRYAVCRKSMSEAEEQQVTTRRKSVRRNVAPERSSTGPAYEMGRRVDQ